MTASQNSRPSKISPAKARRERETLERRTGILAAAREVFFENGLHRATVDDIAARAEVAKGTVYLYFESKETILAHLLLEGLDALGGLLADAYGEDLSLSAERRLRRLAAEYLRFFQEKQDYFQLMMAFDRGRFQEAVSPAVYRQILVRSVRGLRWAVRAIQQGIDEGDFVVTDANTAAGMFWSAINGALVLTAHPLRRDVLEQEPETLYNGVMELMIRGMARPAAESRLESGR